MGGFRAAHGWRATYGALGALCWGAMLPLGVAAYRRKPEEYDRPRARARRRRRVVSSWARDSSFVGWSVERRDTHLRATVPSCGDTRHRCGDGLLPRHGVRPFLHCWVLACATESVRDGRVVLSRRRYGLLPDAI